MIAVLQATPRASPRPEREASLRVVYWGRFLSGMSDESKAAGGSLDSLLSRCGAGDRIAFRELYDLQAARLYGQALRLTRQPQLAADAVHDAFLQVWQRSSRFDPARGRAEAWLTSLLRYRAIDILRKRGRENYGVEPSDAPDPGPDPLAQLASSAEGSELLRCLGELEEGQRRVVLMAFVDGLSHSELATRLQAPLGTVKSWVRRALLGLRRCLEA